MPADWVDTTAASSYPAPSTRVVPAAAADAASIDTDRRTRPVAPGLELTSFDRLDANGWIRADVLTAGPRW